MALAQQPAGTGASASVDVVHHEGRPQQAPSESPPKCKRTSLLTLKSRDAAREARQKRQSPVDAMQTSPGTTPSSSPPTSPWRTPPSSFVEASLTTPPSSQGSKQTVPECAISGFEDGKEQREAELQKLKAECDPMEIEREQLQKEMDKIAAKIRTLEKELKTTVSECQLKDEHGKKAKEKKLIVGKLKPLKTKITALETYNDSEPRQDGPCSCCMKMNKPEATSDNLFPQCRTVCDGTRKTCARCTYLHLACHTEDIQASDKQPNKRKYVQAKGGDAKRQKTTGKGGKKKHKQDTDSHVKDHHVDNKQSSIDQVEHCGTDSDHSPEVLEVASILCSLKNPQHEPPRYSPLEMETAEGLLLLSRPRLVPDSTGVGVNEACTPDNDPDAQPGFLAANGSSTRGDLDLTAGTGSLFVPPEPGPNYYRRFTPINKPKRSRVTGDVSNLKILWRTVF